MATNDQRRTVVGILNALGEANDEVGYHGIRFLWHMFKTKNLRWSDLTSKKVDKVVRERIERVLAHIRDDNLPEARVAVGRVLNMLGTAGSGNAAQRASRAPGPVGVRRRRLLKKPRQRQELSNRRPPRRKHPFV